MSNSDDSDTMDMKNQFENIENDDEQDFKPVQDTTLASHMIEL